MLESERLYLDARKYLGDVFDPGFFQLINFLINVSNGI